MYYDIKKVQTIFFQPSAFVSPFPLCAQSHEETEEEIKFTILSILLLKSSFDIIAYFGT